jgi:hypothetical protein
MATARSGLAVLQLLVLAHSSSACTLVSNLDRFREADAGTDAAVSGGGKLGCGNARTLCLLLQDFSPHREHLVVVDVVSEDGNLRARAQIDPVGDDPDAEVVMPLAIPSDEVPKAGATHPLHLEIWGDASGDREYTPDEGAKGTVDHDWKVPLPNDARLVFAHNSAFKDLLPRPRPIGGDFEFKVTGFGLHAGRRFEVMVIEVSTGRTVGLHRLAAIPESGEFTVRIPGIIDNGGVVYRIEYYADANGSGRYDPKDFTDHSWVIPAIESGADGLHIERPHSGSDIELQALTYQFAFQER